MAQPDSILNSAGLSTDTPYSFDGVQKVKLAIGEFDVGLTPKAAYQGVASALEGDAWAADSTSGVVVTAGIEPGGPSVKAYAVDSDGVQRLGQLPDDTAFASDDYVFPAGFKADESSTDLVDEGDIGAGRMTLDRRQISAAHRLDDSAHGVGTDYVATAGFFADESSTDSVDEGDVGAGRMTLDRKQIVVPYVHAAGGATPYHLLSAGSNNATCPKASAGRLYGVTVNNLNGTIRYLKFYDKASAPNPASDTVKFVVPIPAGTVVSPNLGPGINFATGIAFALVTGISDTDNTGVTASEHVVELLYA